MERASITERRLGSLRWLTGVGERRAVLRALGEHLRSDVQVLAAELPDATDLARRLGRPDARRRFDAIVTQLPAAYPTEWAELESIAEGADTSLESLLLMNMRGDLREDRLGCSGYAQLDDTGLLWGHNEDGSPILLDHCALLTLKLDGLPTITTWWYAGFLPGNTFTFSETGLTWGVFNINLIEPPPFPSRSFVARALQHCTSLDDATGRLAASPTAGGFGYMLCAREPQQARLVEAGAGAMSVVHAHPTARSALWHTNHLLHLSPGSDRPSDSSLQREIVLGELSHAGLAADRLLTVLCDDQVPRGVRMTGQAGSTTLASVVVDQSGWTHLVTPRERIRIPISDLIDGGTRDAEVTTRPAQDDCDGRPRSTRETR